MTNQTKEHGVFIERAEPLTMEGIRAVCSTDKEYEWYHKGQSKGRQEGRQSAQKEEIEWLSHVELKELTDLDIQKRIIQLEGKK